MGKEEFKQTLDELEDERDIVLQDIVENHEKEKTKEELMMSDAGLVENLVDIQQKILMLFGKHYRKVFKGKREKK